MNEETNLKCNVRGHAPSEQKETALQTGLDFWLEYCKYNRSIVDKYLRGIAVTKTTCQNCKNVSLRTEETLIFNLRMASSAVSYTLTQLLEGEAAGEVLAGYQCDKCSKIGPADKSTHIARLPEVLVVQLCRDAFYGPAGAVKNRARVSFDVDRQSFEPAFLAPEDRGLRPGASFPEGDDGFGQQFGYQCYAVVMHDGLTADQGHYYTYLRDVRGGADEKMWYKCNDSRVAPRPGLNMMSVMKSDAKKDADPFLLFFKRRR